MKKLKVYLDTSTISHLRQEDAPEKMQDTLEFWEILKTGKYQVYISEVVVGELSKCQEPKKTELFTLLSEVNYTEISVEGNEDIAALAIDIEKENLLPEKSVNDRLHIAAAMITGCHIIVSWNFNHMVNVKTINGVRMISLKNHLPPADIYTPTMLLERSE